MHLLDRHGADHFQVDASAVLALQPRPFASQRQGRGTAHRIVDGGENDLTPHRRGRHDAEQGQSGGKVHGAVERVDDERQIGGTNGVEPSVVFGSRLFAHDGGGRVSCLEGRGDGGFSRLVGIGHDVEARRLLAHLTGRQGAEPRHDLAARRLGEDIA